MRPLRIALLASGAGALVLAAGFSLQQPWATSLWPIADTRLSYLFIAAILAGAAMPLLWAGASGNLRGLPGYALGFGLMFGAMGSYAFMLAARGAAPALGFGLAAWLLVVLLAGLGWAARRAPADDQALTRVLRIAFMIEIAVLALVGAGLLFQVPNTLPWALAPEASVMYGWVFMGMALYFCYGLARPTWANARGQLLGFLAYDSVLIVPFLQHFANVRPEHLLRLVVATGIVIFSGAIALYYLGIQSATRIWQPEPPLLPAEG